MTLSDFIDANLDTLVDDWTEYAREICAEDSALNDIQLRNSARELLVGIAADMRGAQSDAQQFAKSHGQRPDTDSSFNQIGRAHADDRQSHSFGINALVAEYRALRASVLRRWKPICAYDPTAFQEMIRFNEAIDQMVAMSVRQFAESTQRTRDLFAGVLAHDMRSPVGAILNSAHVVMRDENLSPGSLRAGMNLQRSAERLKLLIDDLFVFTRTRLGDALPIDPVQQDFGNICRGAVEEVRAAKPESEIEVHLSGELGGIWDASRINQLVVNLVSNAVQYGSGSVQVEAIDVEEDILLTVLNGGPPIPERALPTIFDPLTRAAPSVEHKQHSSGVGLGLYICRCIAHAHHGTIDVESNKHGTVFTVKLPRSL